jgi:hypothetical protein
MHVGVRGCYLVIGISFVVFRESVGHLAAKLVEACFMSPRLVG